MHEDHGLAVEVRESRSGHHQLLFAAGQAQYLHVHGLAGAEQVAGRVIELQNQLAGLVHGVHHVAEHHQPGRGPTTLPLQALHPELRARRDLLQVLRKHLSGDAQLAGVQYAEQLIALAHLLAHGQIKHVHRAADGRGDGDAPVAGLPVKNAGVLPGLTQAQLGGHYVFAGGDVGNGLQAGVVLLGGAQLSLGISPLGAEANLLGGIQGLVDHGQGLPRAHRLPNLGREAHDATRLGHHHPALAAGRRRNRAVEREAVVGIGVADQGRAHPKQVLAFLGQGHGVYQGHAGAGFGLAAVVFAAVREYPRWGGQQHRQHEPGRGGGRQEFMLGFHTQRV